jgi:CRISP-associated protein Cas1
MIRPGSPAVKEHETELLPARMVNEFIYCPRLFYLEHVDGLFAHNADTTEGNQRHKRVDGRTDALPKSEPKGKSQSKSKSSADEQPAEQAEPESIHARSVTLSSDEHGVIAKLDLIEAEGDLATPVDYKRGSPKKLPDGSLGAWEPERVQLCVQALVLRANGYRCEEGILFFWETRQRVRIPMDPALVELTVEAIERARETMVSNHMPPPLVDSPKCPRCSLVNICLPDETTRCAELETEQEDWQLRGDQPLLFDVGPRFGLAGLVEEETDQPVRRMIATRDEKRPLYLNTQGYSVGVSSKVLKVKEKGRVVQQVRLHEINQVNLFGAIQMSTQAIQTLLREEIPIVYFSYGGWFYGITQPLALKNILWRREQFRMADRGDFCLSVARQLVSGKIRNQRTLLMRNHVEPPAFALRFLKRLDAQTRHASSLDELLGLEGSAARAYFEHFSGMIKLENQEDPLSATEGPAASSFRFDFTRRNRRPPRDPVNALLSLGYSMLAKDLMIACSAVGLEPYLGFYHQPRHGRPALALDLMEPFRPLVVDSAVLSAINQRMVTAGDFIQAGDSVALTPSGRKGFFRAYEQRMDQLVTHPLFGYRISYRRLLEVQTRLLARVLLGELREYPVFVTR